jgi:flagellar protein FlaG
MSFEIGQLRFRPTSPAPQAPAPAGDDPVAAAAAVLDRSDVIPSSPPPEVLAEVDAAWQRAAELAAQNRELHFARDADSGRVVIEVRTLDGQLVRTIPPSRCLAVMAGGEL